MPPLEIRLPHDNDIEGVDFDLDDDVFEKSGPAFGDCDMPAIKKPLQFPIEEVQRRPCPNPTSRNQQPTVGTMWFK